MNVKWSMFVKNRRSLKPMKFPLANDSGAIFCPSTTVDHKRCSSQLKRRMMPKFEFAIFVVVQAALLAMTQSIFPNFRPMIWHRQNPVADVLAHDLSDLFASLFLRSNVEGDDSTSTQSPQQNEETTTCGARCQHVYAFAHTPPNQRNQT